MIRVSVDVCSGEARFRAAVWAKSIEHALSLVRARYPGGEATVIFPIEPEAFFVDTGVGHLQGEPQSRNTGGDSRVSAFGR